MLRGKLGMVTQEHSGYRIYHQCSRPMSPYSPMAFINNQWCTNLGGIAGSLKVSRTLLQAIHNPVTQRNAGNIEVKCATINPEDRVISPSCIGLLIKRVKGVSNDIIWEYLVQLGKKKLAIERAIMDNINVNEWRNKDGTLFNLTEFSTQYSHEVDEAAAIAQCIDKIEDAFYICSANTTNKEESEMMTELAEEDIDETVETLLSTHEERINAIINKRINDSDEWANASNVWTLETLGRVGGTEAGIFARDLLEFYKIYLTKRRGWKVEDISREDDHGGKLRIEGDNVYQYLKHEIGTHRVQRVPITDAASKMQTSTASVFLMPQPSAVSVDIKESDCKIDFVRGSGPGGQGMQSSSNCCVLTHPASGYTFKVHQARSALGNKELALEMLAQKIWSEKNAANTAFQESIFSKQWTSGERGEKIRTYNYLQGRITDHRIKGKDFSLVGFMEGRDEQAETLHDILTDYDRKEVLGDILLRHIRDGFSGKLKN